MYGDLVRDSLSLCVSTLRVALGSSRGWGPPARPGSLWCEAIGAR